MHPNLSESKHFTLEPLTDGAHACIHKPGGGAYSNAGIIDLGDRTILVDAFDTLAAARDLRRVAERLYGRPIETIVLTHPHSDHWKGASAFDSSTSFLASKMTYQVCLEWGEGMMEDYQNPAAWEEWVAEMEAQLLTEEDDRVRLGLEKSINRNRYTIAEMGEFQPRYPDQTFDDPVTFRGPKRSAKLRSYGRGHSEDDSVLLLDEDGIAFIGDIGFFDTQPFLGFSDVDLYRQQMRSFLDSEYKILVPGHGPVGGEDDLLLQIKYLDVMEELIGNVAKSGGTYKEALQITLPEPFDRWLMGGMARFEVNVRYLFERFGGEVPPEM